VRDVVAERSASGGGNKVRAFAPGSAFPVAESLAMDGVGGASVARRKKGAGAPSTSVDEWLADVPAVSAQELQAQAHSLLRFDFEARVIDGDADVPASGGGLFHHGQQEARPGYSIAELLHLCKSTVFAQRLLAVTVLTRLVARFDAFPPAQRRLVVEAFSLRGSELLQIVRHALDADAHSQLCVLGVELLRHVLACGSLSVRDAQRLAAATGVEPLPAAFAANQQRLLDGLSMRLCIRQLVEMQLVVRLRFLRAAGVDVAPCAELMAYQCTHTAALLAQHELLPPARAAPAPAPVLTLEELLARGEALFLDAPLDDGDVDALVRLHALARAAQHWAGETRQNVSAQRRVQSVARRLLDVLAPHVSRAANAALPWTSFGVLAATHRLLRAAAFAAPGGADLPHDAVLRACCVGVRCGDAASLAPRLFATLGAALELSEGAAATLAALYAESDALRDGRRDWPTAGDTLARVSEAHEALLVTVLRFVALLSDSGVALETVDCAAHVLALYASHSAAFESDVVQAAAQPIVARAVASGTLARDAVVGVADEFCATGVAPRFWLTNLFNVDEAAEEVVGKARQLAKRMIGLS